MTPAEQRVGRIVLGEPSFVVDASIEQVAQRVGVGTTTVMRFCQQAGLVGVRDLRLALAAELATQGRSALVPADVGRGDSVKQILEKVVRADTMALAETVELMDARSLERAVDALDGAERIESYGIGSSAPIAVDAYYRLLRIGLRVSVVTDAHMQAVSASRLGVRDVAFVISHTGRTEETLAAAENAKAAGATVIGLCSFDRPPLERVCDIFLVTASSETAFRVEAMASRIAHLSVVDTLYVALALRRDSAHSVLEATGKVIETKRRQHGG